MEIPDAANLIFVAANAGRLKPCFIDRLRCPAS
jgi:hypothetical protein